jgi:hypothetical protein
MQKKQQIQQLTLFAFASLMMENGRE